MDLFKELFEISTSEETLDSYLKSHMLSIQDFYNSSYRVIAPDRKTIERFILLKISIISQLDYSKSYNKAFISMLLGLAERFNFISSVPKIVSILQTNQVVIGNRLQSALLFLQNIDENTRFVERFDVICKKIQLAIDTEEDYDGRAIATFLNYYGIVINDTHPIFVEELQQKITNAISLSAYSFLSHSAITEALVIKIEDKDSAYDQIQQLIDSLLLTETTQKVDFVEYEEILTEQDTDYSVDLNEVAGNFDSIREISVKKSDGSAMTKRGVKILESEDELLAYMRRFGNMHKAKLNTAFKFLAEMLNKELIVFDWGCGQGIATMILLESIEPNKVKSVCLIEPSDVALKRAVLHVRKYSSEIGIKTVCKKLDDLAPTDFLINKAEATIHLFSNILDIDDYSQSSLINLIEKTLAADNYFICVSPYIDDIKTDRVDGFKRYFVNNHNAKIIIEKSNSGKSNDEYWCCNNKFKGQMGIYCQHPIHGCDKKWTRVIRVFKVDFD